MRRREKASGVLVRRPDVDQILRADRRDNLVLCCRACNALKRDMAPLAFLLSVKTRATNLVRYGAHLSKGLLDMAKPLVRREVYGPLADDDESPYKD